MSVTAGAKKRVVVFISGGGSNMLLAGVGCD
ncbi:glycerate-2-kinase [Sinorhizobium fredii]